MNGPNDFWTRVKNARIVQVLVAYLAVSWGILQVADILQQSLELPPWVQPVALLLFGFAGVYIVIKDQGRSFAPTEAIASNEALPGIAMLPFAVTGGELGEWREGMVNLLSTNLDGTAGLRAIDSRTVMARWDEVAGDDDRVDEETSLRIAEATRARYALLGSAVGIGPPLADNGFSGVLVRLSEAPADHQIVLVHGACGCPYCQTVNKV